MKKLTFYLVDTTIGFKHAQAQLGWNYLEYDNGWPVASKNGNNDKTNDVKNNKDTKKNDSSKSKDSSKKSSH